MRVLIGVLAAWACAWAIVVLHAPDLALVAGLGFLQNLAFTFVSRGRNSGSLWYHMVASVFSNGIWVAMFVIGIKITTAPDADVLPFAFVYCLSTMAGSVFAHWLARKVERGKARNVQEDRVEKIEKRLDEYADAEWAAEVEEKVSRYYEAEERVNAMLSVVGDNESRIGDLEKKLEAAVTLTQEGFQKVSDYAVDKETVQDLAEEVGSAKTGLLALDEKFAHRIAALEGRLPLTEQSQLNDGELLRGNIHDVNVRVNGVADGVNANMKEIAETKRNLEALAREVWGSPHDVGVVKTIQGLDAAAQVASTTRGDLINRVQDLEKQLEDLDRLRHALRTRATVRDAVQAQAGGHLLSLGEIRSGVPITEEQAAELNERVKPEWGGFVQGDVINFESARGETTEKLEEYLEDFSGSLHEIIADAWHAGQKALRGSACPISDKLREEVDELRSGLDEHEADHGHCSCGDDGDF